MKQQISIFTFIEDITFRKKSWNDYSELDQKAWSSFLINRFLSLQYNLIEFVNACQKYTVGLLSSREVYKLYSDAIPKAKLPFRRYIKSKKIKKYNSELIEYMTKYFEISKNEAEAYLDIYNTSEDNKNDLIILLQKYGIDEKKLKILLKTK